MSFKVNDLVGVRNFYNSTKSASMRGHLVLALPGDDGLYTVQNFRDGTNPLKLPANRLFKWQEGVTWGGPVPQEGGSKRKSRKTTKSRKSSKKARKATRRR